MAGGNATLIGNDFRSAVNGLQNFGARAVGEMDAWRTDPDTPGGLVRWMAFGAAAMVGAGTYAGILSPIMDRVLGDGMLRNGLGVVAMGGLLAAAVVVANMADGKSLGAAVQDVTEGTFNIGGDIIEGISKFLPGNDSVASISDPDTSGALATNFGAASGGTNFTLQPALGVTPDPTVNPALRTTGLAIA